MKEKILENVTSCILGAIILAILSIGWFLFFGKSALYFKQRSDNFRNSNLKLITICFCNAGIEKEENLEIKIPFYDYKEILEKDFRELFDPNLKVIKHASSREHTEPKEISLVKKFKSGKTIKLPYYKAKLGNINKLTKNYYYFIVDSTTKLDSKNIKKERGLQLKEIPWDCDFGLLIYERHKKWVVFITTTLVFLICSLVYYITKSKLSKKEAGKLNPLLNTIKDLKECIDNPSLMKGVRETIKLFKEAPFTSKQKDEG